MKRDEADAEQRERRRLRHRRPLAGLGRGPDLQFDRVVARDGIGVKDVEEQLRLAGLVRAQTPRRSETAAWRIRMELDKDFVRPGTL